MKSLFKNPLFYTNFFLFLIVAFLALNLVFPTFAVKIREAMATMGIIWGEGNVIQLAKFSGGAAGSASNQIGNSQIYDDGNMIRMGPITDDNGSTAGWGTQLFFSGGDDWGGVDSDNSDPLYMGRYNIGLNTTELRINLGDDPHINNNDALAIGALSCCNGNGATAGQWITRMYVSSGGNVGIGMTNPGYKLDVSDGHIRTSGAYMAQGGRSITNLPWYNIASSFTGYLKLVTPIVRNEGNMFVIKITGYEYGNYGKVSDIICGGYAYAGTDQLFGTYCNTDGTDLPVEIGTENRGGNNVVVIRLGTPTWTAWYYSHFTAEYTGWQIKNPDDFSWVKAETTPAQTGNTNRVIIDDQAGSITLGGATRTTWPGGMDAPIFVNTIYGTNGDLPWRSTANSPTTMRYVYGPFSYAMPGCPSGYSRYHRIYTELVDNITTGGQNVFVRIAFDGGSTRDFDLGYTWGGSPSYRTSLTGLFQESNLNHASIQSWISGSNGPYLEIRKIEIWTYCI